MSFEEWCSRNQIMIRDYHEYNNFRRIYEQESGRMNRYSGERDYYPEMMTRGFSVAYRELPTINEPKNEQLEKYKSRKLKEYSKETKFSEVKDILPKHISPYAVKLPKEDIKNRVLEYLK